MFVTESRYGNGFCQPGEILRQDGTERDPPGSAATSTTWISPEPLPRAGHWGHRGTELPQATLGWHRGSASHGFERSHSHPWLTPAFPALWAQLLLLQPLPWLCRAEWGCQGWALVCLGAEGWWQRCPQRCWQHRWPSPPCVPRRVRAVTARGVAVDKQAPGCKCHHRNRCCLKQTRALLTLKIMGFLYEGRMGMELQGAGCSPVPVALSSGSVPIPKGRVLCGKLFLCSTWNSAPASPECWIIKNQRDIKNQRELIAGCCCSISSAAG